MFGIGNKMTVPSLRKLEFDLDVNKTTLHNWKKKIDLNFLNLLLNLIKIKRY